MLQGPLPSAQSWKNLAMFELRFSPLFTSNSGCVISRGLTSLHLCMEKAMAPPSFTLAWKIPWTEEPGGLQSMRSRRVGHNWATSLSLFTFTHWRRKWQPTPVFLPGESQGWGSLVGCHLWGCTESDTTEATWQQHGVWRALVSPVCETGAFVSLILQRS